MNPENFILSLRVSVSRKYQTEGDKVTYFLCKDVVGKEDNHILKFVC